MQKILPLVPFIAAIALVACQRDDGPVAKGATVPDNAVLGDAAAPPAAAPANAAAAAAAQEAALPPSTDGMAWKYDAATRTATFGPTVANSAAVGSQLSLECRAAAGVSTLIVRRGAAPTTGKATLSFTGNGHVASLALKATDAAWQGEARGDELRAIAKTFDGPGTVEVTSGGSGDLRVATGGAPTQAIAACLR